jgi:hypothetical protein
LQTKSAVEQHAQSDQPARARLLHLLPPALLLGMAGIFVLIGATLPLYGLWFQTSTLNDIFPWLLQPTRLLFPGRLLLPALFHLNHASPPPIELSWQETGLLFSLFAVQFIIYIVAVRTLPRIITGRYLIGSLIVLGLICSLFPVVTSPDIFSYISYARMGILYHLNPLVSVPRAISHDPVYQYLYWTDQPSAYGPVWAIISGALQWITGIAGTASLAPMVLALRLLGLLAHLWSSLLVWSIAGYLLRARGQPTSPLRMQATLAFAWNPLLLFEACVNAHNDTVVFLFVLLAIWLLARSGLQPALKTILATTALLALGTCLKANVVLLFPGFLLFLWQTQSRHVRTIGLAMLLYVGMIVALYAPFWDQGKLLVVLQVNPGTNRNINTLADFFTRLYNSMTHLLGAPVAPEAGSAAENLLRILSLALFLACYAFLCWQALRGKYAIKTPLALIRWMALAWFLYMMLGTPWFWPWYTVAFFGLVALLEAIDGFTWQRPVPLRLLRFPLSLRLFSFSLLSAYCLYSWAPYVTFVPGLTDFRWAFLRGLWIWLVPLLVIAMYRSSLLSDLQTDHLQTEL